MSQSMQATGEAAAAAAEDKAALAEEGSYAEAAQASGSSSSGFKHPLLQVCDGCSAACSAVLASVVADDDDCMSVVRCWQCKCGLLLGHNFCNHLLHPFIP
jgi:hypothetical protein